MQEYYIRNPESEESRGPFTVEQLTSLGETGHITLETLVYNNDSEEWELLEQNIELRAAVFPEKKRLTVKPKATFESLNQGEADLPPVTIDDLLAAAEGNTEETRHKKKVGAWKEKAAFAAMYILGASLVLSAIGSFLLYRETVFSFDLKAMVTTPLVVVALFDLGVALLLFLQTTSVYPFIRFRAMAFAGFSLFFFWAVGHPLIGLAALLGAAGLYAVTLVLRMVPFLIASALAIFGMLAYLILAIGV